MFNDGDIITKVWMLLNIVHKASTAGPQYAKWAQVALDELNSTYQTLTPAPAEPELPLEPPAEEHPIDE